MSLQKARARLIDPDTGTVLAEVDILTSASAVSYVNDNKTVGDFRGITAGRSFTEKDEVSLQDILDDIIYPYTKPTFGYVTDHEQVKFTEDKTIYVERFDTIRPFYITAMIGIGNLTDLTITLKRFNEQDGTVHTDEITIKGQGGSTYIYQQEVQPITYDTTLQIVVSDGKNVIESPLLSYKFIYPVFVGYCDLSKILSDDGVVIEDTKANSYFNTLIKNTPLLEKRLCPPQNMRGITIDNALYSTRSLHPCILYPNTWNKLTSITDANQSNITGSFLYNAALSIRTDATVSHNVQYTVYACTRAYLVQLAAAGGISYNFTGEASSVDERQEGTPILTGFDVLSALPVDLRTVVQNYEQLSEITYPYDGLVTFVIDEKTFFQYNPKSGWSPTNQQVFLTMTGETPDVSTGSWNDITIDIKTGIFWQKYRNTRWDEKGRFIAGAGFINRWDEGTYTEGSVVYHDNKFWKAIQDTSEEPGKSEAWEETTVGGGIPGPVGPAGDAATIVAVEVKTCEPNEPAKVENIGDMQNARFVFTIPKGEQGDPGVYDGVVVPKPKVAGQVLVSYENGEVNWVDKKSL